MKCAHCQTPKAQNKWTLTACADNRKRVMRLCDPCDIELNRIVLLFLNVPGAAKKIKAYAGRV